MHDDQLREQFTRWAQPLRAARPPALPVLRRRATRRTAHRAAAVSGVAVLAAVAAIAVAGFPRAGHAPSQTPPTVRGVPRFAVILVRNKADSVAEVVNLVTGKILGSVEPPGAPTTVWWVAAAADDRTFALAYPAGTFGVQFYLLHLAASGAPGAQTPMDVPTLRNAQIYGMALTADASKLAVAWQKGPSGPTSRHYSGHISVTTLATGVTRTWTSAQGAAADVSWAGDRTLVFRWADSNRQARSGVRLLDTAAPGTSPLDSRLLLPSSTRTAKFSSLGGTLITEDGSTLLATMESRTKAAIVRFSARTGKLQAVLTPALPTDRNATYCGVLWTDPHGRHLLIECGTTQASIEGHRYTRIHLSRLISTAPLLGFTNYFAW